MTISTVEHSKVALGAIHKLHNFSYADAAARTGATGLTVDNNYQVARQEDNDSFWILLDYSGPTWLLIETGGSTGLWSRSGTVLSPLTDTDTVKAGPGTLVNPSYTFKADGSTGFYSNGVGSVGFSSVGTLKATLDSTGLILNSGGSITSTGNGDVSIVPNGTGVFMCGTGSPGHLTPTSGEAYFQGIVEFDDVVHFDAGPIFYTNSLFKDNVEIQIGNIGDSRIDWSTAQTKHGVIWGLGDTSKYVILCDSADRNTDWGAPDYTDPTFRIQSNDSSDTSEFISLAYNAISLEAHKGTSGNVVSIKSTPGSSSTAKVMRLEADGSNWGVGSRVLEIVSDHVSAIPLAINDGAANVLTVSRTGTVLTSGDVTFSSGGSITSTLNGDISIVPNGSGVLMCGTGSPGHLTPLSGEAYFEGIVEIDGTLYCDGSVLFGSNVTLASNKTIATASSSYGSIITQNTFQTPDTAMITTGSVSNIWLICSHGDFNSDFANSARTDPTFIWQSEDATEVTERGYVSWNEQTIGGGKGSYVGMKSITEEITIPVGQGGLGKKIDSSANLAPATSRIIQVMSRITQAPGGGATVAHIGRTNGGNIDEYADDTAVTLGTTTIASDDGDGVTPIPHWQTSADTIQVGTDFDVTGTDMKIRVVVFYEECTVPTS
jgi:hypothetical protein